MSIAASGPGQKERLSGTDFSVVDRIINHLKLTFVADKQPPAHLACQEVLMAAETAGEYFS